MMPVFWTVDNIKEKLHNHIKKERERERQGVGRERWRDVRGIALMTDKIVASQL